MNYKVTPGIGERGHLGDISDYRVVKDVKSGEMFFILSRDVGSLRMVSLRDEEILNAGADRTSYVEVPFRFEIFDEGQPSKTEKVCDYEKTTCGRLKLGQVVWHKSSNSMLVVIEAADETSADRTLFYSPRHRTEQSFPSHHSVVLVKNAEESTMIAASQTDEQYAINLIRIQIPPDAE